MIRKKLSLTFVSIVLSVSGAFAQDNPVYCFNEVAVAARPLLDKAAQQELDHPQFIGIDTVQDLHSFSSGSEPYGNGYGVDTTQYFVTADFGIAGNCPSRARVKFLVDVQYGTCAKVLGAKIEKKETSCPEGPGAVSGHN